MCINVLLPDKMFMMVTNYYSFISCIKLDRIIIQFHSNKKGEKKTRRKKIDLISFFRETKDNIFQQFKFVSIHYTTLYCC